MTKNLANKIKTGVGTGIAALGIGAYTLFPNPTSAETLKINNYSDHSDVNGTSAYVHYNSGGNEEWTDDDIPSKDGAKFWLQNYYLRDIDEDGNDETLRESSYNVSDDVQKWANADLAFNDYEGDEIDYHYTSNIELVFENTSDLSAEEINNRKYKWVYDISESEGGVNFPKEDDKFYQEGIFNPEAEFSEEEGLKISPKSVELPDCVIHAHFDGGDYGNLNIERVPEPNTLALLALGLAGIGLAGRGRRRRS